MIIEYIAKRNVQSGHTIGETYAIAVDLEQSDLMVSKEGPRNISTSGAQRSVIHRVDYKRDIGTTIIQRVKPASVDDMREFLTSVVDGSEFEIFVNDSDLLYGPVNFDNQLFNDWDSDASQTISGVTGIPLAANYAYFTNGDPLARGPYVTATGGVDLAVQAWVAHAAATDDVSIGVTCYDSGQSFLSEVEFVARTAGQGWGEVNSEVLTHASTAYIKPHIRVASGSAYMTHFTIYEKSPGANVVLDRENFTENRADVFDMYRYNFRVREV